MEDAIRIKRNRVDEASLETQCRANRQPGGVASWCSYALRCVEAQREIEQWSDARIDDLIIDIGSIAARSEDSKRRQSSQLIGDRLRFHFEGSRHVGYTEFPRTNQCVQDTKPSVVAETLEHRLESLRLGQRQYGTLLLVRNRFRRTAPTGLC